MGCAIELSEERAAPGLGDISDAAPTLAWPGTPRQVGLYTQRGEEATPEERRADAAFHVGAWTGRRGPTRGLILRAGRQRDDR